MSSFTLMITPAKPNDTNQHFLGDNNPNSYTTLLAAVSAIAIAAANGNTVEIAHTGAPVVGNTYYAFTNNGHYATVQCLVANGTSLIDGITAGRDVYRVAGADGFNNVDKTKRNQIPTGTLTIHSPSIAGNCDYVYVESVAIRSNITAITTLTITDAIGGAIDAIVVPIGPTPTYLAHELDGRKFNFPIGFTLSAGSQLGLDMSIRLGLTTPGFRMTT